MYLASNIMLRCLLCYVLACVRDRILCFICTACSHPIRACEMDGGNTHMFCTVTTGLHSRGGNIHDHCILIIVQHCHVSTKHLLVDTFSCICILLSELGACSYIDLLLVTSSCRSISGDEITWHLLCEHHGARRWFQQALDIEVDKASVSLTQCKGEFE